MLFLKRFAPLLLGALVFLTVASGDTFAHVKWFVHSSPASVERYSLTELSVLVFLAIAAFSIGTAAVLNRLLKIPEKYRLLLSKFEKPVVWLFTVLIGVALIAFSFNGYLFTPNLELVGHYSFILIIIQGLCGLLLILGLLSRPVAVLLLLLYLVLGFNFGVLALFETVNMLGVFLFILIVGRSKPKLFDLQLKQFSNFEPYAVPILRVLTGINLLILGFSEKILNPHLGVAFLDERPWNFMQILGLEWFSDRTFVLFAGGFEALFGVLLILGLVTRLTTAALAGFFVTTLILLGPVELIGHLPHFATVFVLLVYGSGDKFKITNLLQPRKVFTPPNQSLNASVGGKIVR